MRADNLGKLFLVLGTLNGFLAVALGAFGAHGLRTTLTQDLLRVYETGVQYHMSHALGLVALGIAARWLPSSPQLKWAGWCFVAGMVLFSGSLYLLTVAGIRWVGVIAPFGGTAFMLGWLLFAVAAYRGR